MKSLKVKETINSQEKPRWWYYLAAALLLLIFLLPLYVLINMSFRTIQDIGSKLALPETWNFDNYVQALKGDSLWTGFKNSIFLTVLTVAIEIAASALGAYGLVRSNSRLANYIRSLNMGIMMIPTVALLVGTYSLMANLHMTNSLTGLAFLTAAGGIPGTMFMYMNFIVSIPNALDEAAAIDGAGVLSTFYHVIMPQLKPVTVTRVIMSAVWAWNNYLMPMFLLQNKSKFTVILVIKSAFNSTNGLGNIPLACATCVLGLLPIIVLYLFLQKYIIEGQIDSSVK